MTTQFKGDINFFGKLYKTVPAIEDLAPAREKNASIKKLDQSITNFNELISDIDFIFKEDFKNQIKKRFIRQAIKAHIKKGLHEIKKAKSILEKEAGPLINGELISRLNIAASAVGSAQKMIDYHNPSSVFAGKKLHEHIITAKEIQEGDVMLSYKTSDYLKNPSNFLSYLIATAQSSSITHSWLVSKKESGEFKILISSPETRGVSETFLKIKPGEIIFVMRPKIGEENKKKLVQKIEEFIGLAKKNPDKYKFSEKKCWTACILGLVYTRGILFGSKNVILQNPIWKSKGYFCAELVEAIFAEVGICLTPRGNCRGVLGPAEIFYSPHLEYKGIYCPPTFEIKSEEKLNF